MGQEIFLFSKVYRLLVGPIHPPVRWVPRLFPEG